MARLSGARAGPRSVCVGGGREVCEHPGQGGLQCTQCARGSIALCRGCSGRSIAGASWQDLGFLLTRETHRVIPALLQTPKVHAITCTLLIPGHYSWWLLSGCSLNQEIPSKQVSSCPAPLLLRSTSDGGSRRYGPAGNEVAESAL